MPRKVVPILAEFPYSISARCINKEWFSIPLDEVWKVMEDYLYFLSFAFNFKIKSFVLMSNHFHMIVQAPNGNLSEGMNYFMRETSRVIGKKAGRINQIYGGRFYRSMIKTNHYYSHAYKYIYRNPVEAGISSCVLDYPYSTLYRMVKKGEFFIPVEYDNLLFDEFQSTLEWLNEAPSIEDYQVIKNALRKSEFKLPKDINSKKTHKLESERY